MADEKSTNEPQGQAEGAGAVPTFLTDPVQQQLPGTPAAPAPAALNNPRADIAALNKLEMHLYAHRYAQTGISSEMLTPTVVRVCSRVRTSSTLRTGCMAVLLLRCDWSAPQ